MEMAESKDWLNVFDRVQADVSALSDKLRGPSTRKYDAERQLRGAKGRIDSLDDALTQMENAPHRSGVGEGELSRRRGLLAGLKKQTIAIEDQLSGATSRTRRELLAATGKTEDLENDATRNMSHAEVHQQTQLAMKQQDADLDSIARGVTSLKELGHGMSNELDLHKALLDDLDHHIDKTDAAFQNNTKRIDVVQEEDGSGALGCGLMLCMVLLLVLIVFLASSNQACHIFKPSKC